MRLHELGVAAREGGDGGGPGGGPHVGVEDLDLDVARVARGGDGAREGGEVDVPVAHHPAREQGVRRERRGRMPEQELAQLRTLIANRVGGIVIAGSGFVDPAMQAEARRDLDLYRAGGGRVAVIGRHHLGADAVLPDNVGAGRSLVRHVLDLGHRELAFVAGSRALTTVADRLAGAAEALAEHGLDLDRLPVLEAEFTRAGGKEAARRVLAEHPRTTAVVALNDDMAIGVLSVLRAEGIAVPRDMSVVGFDDIDVAEDLSPSLTTVRLPMVGLGEMALSLALKPSATRPRRRTTEHELVVRDSTAEPRSS